ncbi:MAG: hypothetical protein DRJ03_02115 [Chloroflexi bacterium]|nr:MAG: hypothetical protein DRJ03_02115 [Chloroflexota bacterium]
MKCVCKYQLKTTGDAPEQLARLFEACSEDVHYSVLEELCFTAGLLWCCKCGYNNYEDDEVCTNCGAERPEESE